MTTPTIMIYKAMRTPMGAFQGQLSQLQGWQIGASILSAFKDGIHRLPCEVIMGNVLGAGQGQAPCRQAVIGAFQDFNVCATTINKVCGSGLKAIMFAVNQLHMNPSSLYLAGGFESMSNAPYILPKARSGYRMGHGAVFDHMLMDGLEDAYDIKGGTRRAMGEFADRTAEKYQFSRADQEAYVAQGFAFFSEAKEKNLLAMEIHPVVIQDAKGNIVTVQEDEPPLRVKPEKFGMLRPAFSKEGTVTAATSSSIADGAAAVLVATEGHPDVSLDPLARIVGFTSFATAPEWFTLAPIGAIQKLLSRISWSTEDVDLFEINEAFAVVAMAAIADLKLDRSRVNVHGGACTVGHPIGASGARVLVTLINALKARGKKRGIAALCIGGGEAVAMAIELV